MQLPRLQAHGIFRVLQRARGPYSRLLSSSRLLKGPLRHTQRSHHRPGALRGVVPAMQRVEGSVQRVPQEGGTLRCQLGTDLVGSSRDEPHC